MLKTEVFFKSLSCFNKYFSKILKFHSYQKYTGSLMLCFGKYLKCFNKCYITRNYEKAVPRTRFIELKINKNYNLENPFIKLLIFVLNRHTLHAEFPGNNTFLINLKTLLKNTINRNVFILSI